jgi:hypothetical protein
MNTRRRSTGIWFRTGTVLVYFLSFVLAASAIAKFAQIPKVASQMAALGFNGGKLILIAALEIASAILFAYPRTRSVDLLIVSAYLGGAAATHVGHNELPFQPAIVLALFWLACWLRHREVLWSVSQSSSS